MVARLLKLFEFQKHLDLTVKTLARSGQDLMHFMVGRSKSKLLKAVSRAPGLNA